MGLCVDAQMTHLHLVFSVWPAVCQLCPRYLWMSCSAFPDRVRSQRSWAPLKTTCCQTLDKRTVSR